MTILDGRDELQPAHLTSLPRGELVIDGTPYFTAAAVARAAGISRQTLWRWRQDRKVPVGKKYRDKQVVFTRVESNLICDYANRLEPIELASDAGNERLERGDSL